MRAFGGSHSTSQYAGDFLMALDTPACNAGSHAGADRFSLH
jgi:hypothetical protein